VCVCVCVCVRERLQEKFLETAGLKEIFLSDAAFF
jgi:polysaccharide pyruvyl transferase WcaK-like protein